MRFTLETAPPEILIEAFADLLSNRSLFKPDYGSALDELIYNLPDDDLNAIASSIKTWCQARPVIREALENALGKGCTPKSVASIRHENYKRLLKNKLRESFPETALPYLQ